MESKGMRKDTPDAAFGRRAKQIRQSYGETADLFAERLTEAGWRATKAEVSRIENAKATKLFSMVDAYARLDPERRGRLWIGWGLQVDDLKGKPITKSGGTLPTDGKIADHLREVPPPATRGTRRRA